jgi:GNAT superfamily N-acetyltransferase
MNFPNNARCEPVIPDNLSAALADMPALGVQGRISGFQLVADEPDLYNKWLYTIADVEGRPALLGLSQRFCPIDNVPFAGFSIYHPALLDAWSATFTALRKMIHGFLRIPKKGGNSRCKLRGLLRGLTVNQKAQWGGAADLAKVKCVESSLESASVERERHCVQWYGATGPVWSGDGEYRVHVAGLYHFNAVLHHQQQLGRELGHGFATSDERETQRGIRNLLSRHGAHGGLSIFNRGAFLVAENGLGHAVGSAWVYRSFNPIRAGWTIWMRRPFVHPDHRKRGVFRNLAQAAVGMLAEGGFPVHIRELREKSMPDSAVLGKIVVDFHAGEGMTFYAEIEDFKPK